MTHINTPERHSQKHIILLVIAIVLLSFLASSSYRGIANDEGLGGTDEAARRILSGQPLYDGTGATIKMPARFLYSFSIAAGYKLLGFNLLVLHLIPYLIQLLNPCLFFWISYRFSKNAWWAAISAIFFIFHPFALVFLNQQYSSSLFMCWLLLLILTLDLAHKNPRWLLLSGLVSSLLLLTRLEEGGMFVLIFYGTYLLARRKNGLPFRWLALSVGTILIPYVIAAKLFGFPILYPLKYLPYLTERQSAYGEGWTFVSLSKRAFRSLTYWYLGGKYVMPFMFLLVGMGTFQHVKTRNFYPLALFWPHFLFMLFVYNARNDIMNLGIPYSVPGFILLLLSGVQSLSLLCAKGGQKISQHTLGFLKKLWRPAVFQVAILLLVAGSLLRSAHSLMIVANDVIPASTMWRIVKNNPPMPGNPSFKETFIQLNREEQMPVLLREELYRAVRGDFRSWFVQQVAKYAFKHDFPEYARANADFVYTDNYDSKEQWEKDRVHFEGNSPLWLDAHAGRIGAFPRKKSGTFIYKFQFPKPIDYLTLSDIHSQWGFGDRTKMWTSFDGETWTLRYDHWNIRGMKDPYYWFFENEFDGVTTLFVKYYFYAGDKTRAADDNRGACLEEFSLAAKYKNE